MSDEYEPDTPIISVETPSLSGTPTTLMGSEGSATVPDGTGNYDFITGPDGQTYAVMKEPFVWKKFFIGLGIPLFLMIVPIILAMIAEGIDYQTWDKYESEFLDLELENGTNYSATYTLDSDRHLEWCAIHENYAYENRWYYCEVQDNSLMTVYAGTRIQVDLVRGNGTSYYANFSLESGQMFRSCEALGWEYDGWVYCEVHVQEETIHAHILKETWDDDGEYSSAEVGYWNSTTEVITYDDGENHGVELEMFITIHEEVGIWTQEEGIFRFDSGEDHGNSVDLEVETIDKELYEQGDTNQNTVDVLLGIAWIMCMGAPLISIAMVIYGFAASGGKAIGVGASVALASFPILGFFGCVAIFSAGW